MSKQVAFGAQPAKKPQTVTADTWVENRVTETESIKRLTIDIPQGLHRRLKLLAAGLTIGQCNCRCVVWRLQSFRQTACIFPVSRWPDSDLLRADELRSPLRSESNRFQLQIPRYTQCPALCFWLRTELYQFRLQQSGTEFSQNRFKRKPYH